MRSPISLVASMIAIAALIISIICLPLGIFTGNYTCIQIGIICLGIGPVMVFVIKIKEDKYG